ncbi:MAG TPA: GNAT family N-acetyltransferase [Caulobacteraceae bacterium]|jgi:predicted N-acetyltransferase YhbS|nr:GNAT family N-acetyltransferase [Caulobacteraceae bacterium]
MTLSLRRGVPSDAAVAGDICYRAFKAIADAHNFTPDFPSAQSGIGAIATLIAHPGAFDLVAELDGRIVGSNFLDERNPISGVGPITVDPDLQNDGVGRALMRGVMDRSAERGFAGVRLLQAGYHHRSLALYLKLGFEAREPVACLQGPVIGKAIPGYAARPATTEDAATCNRLCIQTHGHHRGGELAEAIARGTARVVERGGRITGYATRIAYFAHAVAETNDDLKALIAAAESFDGPGFLVPARNGELMRWGLDQGLRITHTLTLMSIGLYNQPEGAWLPSVIY